MRKPLIGLAVLALAACDARATQASLGAAPADAAVEATLATARMLYARGAYQQAEDALQSAVQPAAISAFSPARRHELVALYAQAAVRGGDIEQARWASKVATEEPQASPDDWQTRLMASAGALDNADAYAAFEHLRQQAPDRVRSIPPGALAAIASGFAALPNADDAQARLAKVLLPAGEMDARFDFSALWLHAAAISLERGQAAEAAVFARRVTDPQVMVELRADRRFDAIVAADPQAFDPRELAERELAAAKTEAAARPGAVAPQYKIATALYHLGRDPEALAALDTALLVRRVPAEEAGYGYALAARKVTVLAELGRYDDALALTASMCTTCAAFSWQQAHLLLELDRADEALPLLPDEPVFGVSEEGLAEFAAERACAEHRLGHQAVAMNTLAPLRRNPRINADAEIGAIVCVGSDDEVAQALIAMLNDPVLRDAALGALQTYREGKLPPLTAQLRARLARISTRADVQAALAEVGRVSTWAMPRYTIVG